MRHKGIVWTAEFSPDGTRLLSTSADRTAQLWNAQTGQPIGNPMRHPKGVQMGMFSADGRRVATGSEDGTARVWDAMTGEPLSPPLRRPNPTALNAIRFSPDGRWLLTMDLRGAYLWDAQTGLSISEAMMPLGEVNRACFHPDGTWFWTFSGAGMAQAWKVVDPPSPVARWLPDLAEGLAGRRLDARGELLSAPPEGLLELRERLLAAESNDFYLRWGRWFFRERLEGGSGKPKE